MSLRSLLLTITLAIATLSFTSCHSGKKAEANAGSQAGSLSSLLAEAPGDSVRLCDAALTSLDNILVVENDPNARYGSAPDGFTFYEPGEDIKDDPVVKQVMNSYNFLLVRDMIFDEAEWLRRALLDASFDFEDENRVMTRSDTIRIVGECRFDISESKLKKAIPDDDSRRLAAWAIKAFNAYDGREDVDGNPLFGFTREWKDYIAALKPLTSDDQRIEFEKGFWKWYDKSGLVPGIEDLMVMRASESKSELSDEQVASLMRLVVGESDIDRRTILSIEALHHSSLEDHDEAFFNLGEILESGQYTKYIMEGFILWRATAQELYFGSSSMSSIPNDYYNKVRAKCVDTVLRNYLKTKDSRELCLIDNLIGSGIIRRFGWYYGNEAMIILLNAKERYFLPPQVLGFDYLKEDEILADSQRPD